LCNKICGAAHYNMKMEIKVVSEEDYNKWLSEQKEFLAVEESTEAKSEEAPQTDTTQTKVEESTQLSVLN